MAKDIPHDLDAEKSLLGSVMLDGNKLDDVLDIISPEDFHWIPHGRIFSAIADLRKEGKPIDVVTVASRLEASGDLQETGGATDLVKILETVPHSAHAEYYAEMVAAKSRLRAIIRICRKASEDAMDGKDDSDIIADAETALHSILERSASNRPVSIRVSLEEIFHRLDSKSPPGIPMGLEKLDELYQLQGGNLVVIAARPSMGKTGLAVNVALNVARQGKGVLFFSLEQNKTELAGRFLSCQSRISSLKISRMEPIEDAERMQLLSSSSDLAQLPIYTVDDAGMSVSKIAAHSRLWKRRHNIELVIVDYLQLVEAEDKKVIREQQVAGISRGLKKLAGQLGIPVVVMAQLNRDNDKRPDKKPRLSDIRESGSIEQDANCVILIHRPEYYNLTERPGEADLDVAKNRDGRTGIAKVQFDVSTITFRDLAPKWQSGWVDDF